LFKRRKPDEPASGPGGTLPAGLSAGPNDMPEDGSFESTVHPAQMFGSARAQGQPQGDTGLGVPPFRPAPPKEAQSMARPPFSTAPTGPAAVPPVGGPRPGMPGPRPAAVREPGERRTLIVGRGISVQGTVQDAERLVVEGTVEASMIHATELAIAPGGVFKGEVEVEDAEIAGTIDGTLTVRSALIVRASGKVMGKARCRRLQVEDGGQITGQIEMLTDQPRTDAPRATAEPAV
jgi:cytoskeletal protein CcmA (bactofilin family)